MRQFIVGGLSVLLLSAATAPGVLAQQSGSMNFNTTSGAAAPSVSNYQIEPFNLAWMAYQGYFQDQGIPKGRTLISAFESAQVSARDIVQAAAKSGRMSVGFQPSDAYLGAMELTLGRIADR